MSPEAARSALVLGIGGKAKGRLSSQAPSFCLHQPCLAFCSGTALLLGSRRHGRAWPVQGEGGRLAPGVLEHLPLLVSDKLPRGNGLEA